jgi:hypothetical protein
MLSDNLIKQKLLNFMSDQEMHINDETLTKLTAPLSDSFNNSINNLKSDISVLNSSNDVIMSESEEKNSSYNNPLTKLNVFKSKMKIDVKFEVKEEKGGLFTAYLYVGGDLGK